MSMILPSNPATPNWLARAFEREYCPAVEPYLTWLRQPVGWFVLATAASILVGVTVAPLALSLAAGLLSLLFIGLAYPWLAVRMSHCELVSTCSQLEEDETHEVELRVRNVCPWPLWGLVIEGLVVQSTDDMDESDAGPCADIALGYVPWLSRAVYRLSIHPRLRGRYPLRCPQLTCAFPFGLWTARRSIQHVSSIIVRPKKVKLVGMLEQTGFSSHHFGDGSRSGGHGDFLGLRDYRMGDSIRHIHWAHTARLDSMVVCERSAAEQSPWHIVLATRKVQPGSRLSRENLAWRVRVAASLCTLLHQQAIPFALTIEGEEQWTTCPRPDHGTRPEQAIERLTDVPLDGSEQSHDPSRCIIGTRKACCLQIDAVDVAADGIGTHGFIRIQLHRVANQWRPSAVVDETVVDLGQPIATQLNAWLQRMNHGRQAAA